MIQAPCSRCARISLRCAARPRKFPTCSVFPTSITTASPRGASRPTGRSSMSMLKPLAGALLITLAFGSAVALAADPPRLGKPVSEADIKPWDISVLPDGTNLPAGSGTPAQGAKLYVDKGCNQCHGDNGKGGPSNVLVGNPSLTADGIASNKTIANFWAYPTTLFDYIRRAMPWPTPHTLTDDEVYAICAYLLAANELI